MEDINYKQKAIALLLITMALVIMWILVIGIVTVGVSSAETIVMILKAMVVVSGLYMTYIFISAMVAVIRK